MTLLLPALLTAALIALFAYGAQRVDFVRDIKPILQKSWYKCHRLRNEKGGLALATMTRAVQDSKALRARFPIHAGGGVSHFGWAGPMWLPSPSTGFKNQRAKRHTSAAAEMARRRHLIVKSAC